MILILTTKGYEQGTGAVLDWLIHSQVPFFVLNYEDLVTKEVDYHIDIGNDDVYINGISVKNEVSVIWYRRFYLSRKLFGNAENTEHVKQLRFESNSELDTLLTYLWYIFREKLQVSKAVEGENKLIYLDLAKKSGLSCPESIVTNSREQLRNFYQANKGEIISKPIYFSKYYSKGNITYSVQTRKYDENMINSLPEFFFPTLFQQSVASKFEIRVFYLNGRIYSTAAIFDGEGKNIDLKLNYKSEYLHWVVYRLPENMENKIRHFMNRANLNTGSIDLLRTESGYFFLEVNPVGQYLAPSEYCNYFLEFEISEFLKYESNARKI